MSTPTVGFAGMTHLGVTSAAAALQRGFGVVGFDPDAAVIAGLKQGKPPVMEPGLQEILHSRRSQATFSHDARDLARCELVYISSDVATDDQGRGDLSRVRSLVAKVAPALNAQAILVVLCQVPPGFTRALEFASARRYYQVETLVFGQAVERALNPERFIVGCADPAAPLPAPYRDFLAAFGCPVLPMRYESAELAKIAINCCLVSSVSVANTLAELCERLGADWGEILPALRLDRRIGAHAYLKPGLGIAGGNLERDLATVIRLAEEHGTDAGVVQAWLANSRHSRDWAVRAIKRLLLAREPKAAVAVWGLAYKENTDSVKNSPSLATIAQLKGATLRLHDPAAPGGNAREPLEAAHGADALMILTPWPQYREIEPARIAAAMRGRLVLDPYRVLNAPAAAAAGLELHCIGRGDA
jgi:UDPglucose 6-dehydrogenase